MGLDEWRKFVTDLRLMDHVLTPRLVTLVFVWSRMRVVGRACNPSLQPEPATRDRNPSL